MQLNIYVPKEKAFLLKELDRTSRQVGRPKNELILEALERYLSQRRSVLGRYHLGVVRGWRRGELYERRLG